MNRIDAQVAAYRLRHYNDADLESKLTGFHNGYTSAVADLAAEQQKEPVTHDALADFANDLLDAWNIEDENPPSLTEQFLSMFVDRFEQPATPTPLDPPSTTLSEVAWFQAVLDSSRADLRETPVEHQPTWYRQHVGAPEQPTPEGVES